MNELQDWLMTLPKQPLTEELKIEILSRVNKTIETELITMLKNLAKT
jgi:hypothetical protein